MRVIWMFLIGVIAIAGLAASSNSLLWALQREKKSVPLVLLITLQLV